MGKQSVEAPRATHFNFDPDELIIIGLDTKDGPEHPLYDPRIMRPLDPERVKNFRMYGVLKPIIVRKNGDAVEVVEGRGRVRYARAVKALQAAAGEETIRVPGLIKKGDDAYLYGISRAGNLHDADGPMLNAKNAQKLIDMGKSIPEVATTFGVTEQTIRNWTMMLDAAPEVIDAMIKEEISATVAVVLAALPKTEQNEVLAELKTEAKEGSKATVEKAKRKVAAKAGNDKPTNTPKDKIARATNLLIKFTGLDHAPTKEDYATVLERVCKAITGGGLEKLAKSEEE